MTADGAPDTMRAARFHAYGGPEVLQIEEVPVPDPGPGEILMRVHAAGVSGWDVRARRGKAPQVPGRPPPPLPFQPGREAAGEVAAVGPGVTGLAVGDRVVMLASAGCGTCAYCTKRATHMCVVRGLPGHSRPGACAEYLVLWADEVAPTPPNLTDEQAAPIAWAYGTAMHMLGVADFRIGDSVLVIGASSAMGIACLQLARVAGSSTVIAVTRSPAKHDPLRALGADEVVGLDLAEIDRIRELVRAIGVDVTLDNFGNQETLTFGLEALDLGGRFVMIGNGPGGPGELQGIDPLKMIGKELSVRASRGQTRWDQVEALRMAARGQISMPVAEVLPLAEIRRAHELQEAAAHVGKIVVTMS